MKKLIPIIVLIFLISISVQAQDTEIGRHLGKITNTSAVKFLDDMNGNNTVSGLQARGWVVLNVDGGGTTDPWYQGRPERFSAFEGPDTGYVAANFLGANANGVIDQWLITPSLNYAVGDTLYFFCRSDSVSSFDDSLNVLYSQGSTDPSTFTNLGRLLVPKTGWSAFYATLSNAGSVRFAFRYYIFDGGATGQYSDYIGIDYVILTSNSGTTYPTTIDLSKTYTFGDAAQSGSYRMVGLPGNNSTSISSIASGTQKKDWDAFYDNGNTDNYLVEFDGSSNFNLGQGKGLWFLSKNSISVSQTVNTVTLSQDNSYSIPIHSGWNIISNPFEKSVAWANVQNMNGLAANTLIYNWNGNWTNPSSMNPYDGYYFNNTQGLTSLKIPYPTTTSLSKQQYQTPFNINANSSLKISLDINGNELSNSIINFDESSNNDFDNKDYFAPPGDFDDARINLVNKNLSTDYKQLFVESRPDISDGQSFDLNFKNTTNKNANLKIEGIENFPGYEIYLLDKILNRFYNLKQQSSIQINSDIKKQDYSLLIGTKKFINSLKDELTPKEFTLYQNYPNPFNPSTLIRYQIPLKELVTIKVYDILGKEVETLVNDIQDPGYYEVKFDGFNLSSGIYFYRVKAGNFSDVKKMMLIK